jgi:hypothetical protein
LRRRCRFDLGLIGDVAAMIERDRGRRRSPQVRRRHTRDIKMNGKRRLIGSLAHGSMANTTPLAIGVQATFPGRQVASCAR